MKKLFTASRKGDIEAVKSILTKQPELLSCVAVPPPKKDAGQSLLQVAFKTGMLDIAEYLIELGADVNYIEDEGCGNFWRTPVLHDAINAAITACRWNTYSPEFGLKVFSTKEEADRAYNILEKMIDLGADVSAVDSIGNNVIWRAVTQAEQILPRMDKVTGDLSKDRVFTPELEEDLRRVFTLLLNHGADLSYVRKDIGMTVFELSNNKLFKVLVG